MDYLLFFLAIFVFPGVMSFLFVIIAFKLGFFDGLGRKRDDA